MVTLTPPRAEPPIVLPALALADDLAEQSVEDAWQVQHARRVAREPRPRSGPQARCSACNKFLGGHLCSCGYVPGQGYPR